MTFTNSIISCSITLECVSFFLRQTLPQLWQIELKIDSDKLPNAVDKGIHFNLFRCFRKSLSSVRYVPQAFGNSRMATDIETCIAVVVIVDRTFNDVKYSLKSVGTQCVIRFWVSRLIMINLGHKLTATQNLEVLRSRNKIDSHCCPIFETKNDRGRQYL